MGDFRRWVRPLAMSTVAGVAVACGSSEQGPRTHPDAGEKPDAARDASHPGSSAGGAGGAGAGGAAGSSGVSGMMGAGCALGADAGPSLLSAGNSEPDASTVMDAFDAGGGDASARDAAVTHHDAGADGSLGKDSGTTPVSYPPLEFAKIGKVAVISNQFLFTEGPVWDPASEVLFFTDINADVVYRLKLPDTLDVAADHVGNADGLALHPEGYLIGAGFVSRDIWKFDGTKVTSVVQDYRGRKLNSPDDLIARSDGVIYFTDPTFGIDGSQGFTAQVPELCFQGVYRLTSTALYLEDSSTGGPNGVNFSPDEKTLYVSYTGSGQIFSFDVARDGALSNKQLFATVLLPDSMCVDAGGNLYAATFSGITVYDPKGKQLGVIATPGQVPTNCAFGGPDQRTFFITARTGLAGTPTKGNSSLLRVDGMPVPGMPGKN